jgi:hypothetical protein
MPEFLAALLAFPTVVFSILLAVVLLYWLTVIIGALHIDLGSPDGGHDADMIPGGHDAHGFLEFLSIGKVPITITISLFVFLAWMLGMFAELVLRAPVSAWISGPLFSAALVPAIVLSAMVVTAYAVRPLRGLFSLVSEHGETGLVGRMVRITSMSVDHGFGTAVCDNAGPGILLNVVSRPGVTLARDAMAVVVEYDPARQVYLVAPFSHLPPEAADLTSSGSPPALPPAVMPSVATMSPPSTPAPAVSLERQQRTPQ